MNRWLALSVASCLVVTPLVAIAADPTDHLRSLGARFMATGFHAGWSGDSRRIVYGDFPSQAGLHVIDATTRKGKQVSEVGKDPTWSPAKDGPIAYVVGNGEE